MRTPVVLVLAAALTAAVSVAAAGAGPVDPVDVAARASGLEPLRSIRLTRVAQAGVDAAARRELARLYPAAARKTDAILYADLGLAGSLEAELAAATRSRAAVYDVGAGRLYLRRNASRAAVVEQAVRALEVQHYGLAQLSGLRGNDRDAALAGEAVVDGAAAAAAGTRLAPAPAAPTLRRFLALEQQLGRSLGAKLLGRLRYYGGAAAAATAFTPLPQTTAQVAHLDGFLERDLPPAGGAAPPKDAAGTSFEGSETFGELDAQALLATFHVTGAAVATDGWVAGGARVYRLTDGSTAAALALDWSSESDADAWQAAAAAYARAAFPAAPGRVAFVRVGSSTILVAAPDPATAARLAAGLGAS